MTLSIAPEGASAEPACQGHQEVLFFYSNFSLPDLAIQPGSKGPIGPGLVAQANGQSTMLLSRDDGPALDKSWRITNKQRAEVYRLYASGLSITKTAKEAGMSWSTAKLILDESGPIVTDTEGRTTGSENR